MVSQRAALISDGICTGLALLVLVLRLGSVLILRQPLDALFYIVLASTTVLISRAITNSQYLHIIDLDVLRNQPDAYLTPQQMSEFKRGMILILISRFLITTFYWLQATLLLSFYTRLLRNFHQSWRMVIAVTWGILALTYVMVVLATFLECHPFNVYWQISPTAYKCRKAYIQLFSQGASSLVLDSLLLIISFPILRIQAYTPHQQVRIAILYCLGFICIVITSIRVALTKNEHSSQQVRSLWASVQALVSAFVANAPTIYGNGVLLTRGRKASNVFTPGPLVLQPERNASNASDSAQKDSHCSSKAYVEHVEL